MCVDKVVNLCLFRHILCNPKISIYIYYEKDGDDTNIDLLTLSSSL